MPQSKRRRQVGHGEIVPPLSKLDRIGELLQVHSETFPNKELNPAEIARWEMALKDYRLEAIEFAFDNWWRNGQFFPVPADILSLCDAWLPKEQVARGCTKECKERHHKGYSETDVLKLWNLFNKKRAEVNRALTESEQEELLDALDKTRAGGAPEWRL
jgi:hypothetical protein